MLKKPKARVAIQRQEIKDETCLLIHLNILNHWKVKMKAVSYSGETIATCKLLLQPDLHLQL